MNKMSKNSDPITEAKPHTIKKFELISRYVEGWAHKVLGCSKSKGIAYIDCMCNSGMYFNEKHELIEGTAIRVAKELNSIIPQFPGKKIDIFFNDIDEKKVMKLQECINSIGLNNINISYNIGDGNEYLKNLYNSRIKTYSYFNTLMVYDPYDASLDWEAISPYLHTWGEVIINHMVSDTSRAAHLAQTDLAIKKYQKTYQTSIEEIIKCGSDRKKLDDIILNILRDQTATSKREHFIASFPFYNRNNGHVYNLIQCCSNIDGLILFKKIAWKTFGGKSSLKNTHGLENQLCFTFDEDESVKTETDENCFYVKDIAKYVYEKYNGEEEVALDEIYNLLDRHPIFPSDGFKKEIKGELKITYGVFFPKRKNTAIFRME